MNVRRTLTLTMAAVLALALLAGCSSSSGEDKGNESIGSSTNEDQQTLETYVVEGIGSFTLPEGAEIHMQEDGGLGVPA